MRAGRLVRALAAAVLLGASTRLVACGNTCDVEVRSPTQGTMTWSVVRQDGAILTSGCAVAHASPDPEPMFPESPLVPTYADVIQFHAAVGDVVTVTARDNLWSFRFSGLCSAADAPSLDLTDSSVFCSPTSGGGVREGDDGPSLSGCEIAASSTEPAEIVSSAQGDASAGYPDVLTLRIRGTGAFHVARTTRRTSAPFDCTTTADPNATPFALLTILAP